MIEPTLVAALEAIFPGKVFPATVPPGVEPPLCIYQQVGGVPSNTVCGDTNHQNMRIQFWVWCDQLPSGGGYPQAVTLMRSLAAIVTASPFLGVSRGSLSTTFDLTTRRHGAVQDFSVWY